MLRNSLIVVVLALLAEAAEALSLGAPQGKVWLGQPIDLGFEVQLDPACRWMPCARKRGWCPAMWPCRQAVSR